MQQIKSILIGVDAIGTLGTWALPDKERNLVYQEPESIEVLSSIQGNPDKTLCYEGLNKNLKVLSNK